MGRSVAREVETKFKVFNDPELTAYVDKVGQRIARVCERPNIEYHFKILNDPMINAFACPGALEETHWIQTPAGKLPGIPYRIIRWKNTGYKEEEKRKFPGFPPSLHGVQECPLLLSSSGRN